MNSVVLLLIGIAVALGGYFLYARRIDRKVFQADPKRATPARLYMDGVDFVPTSRYVLFGYQFKAIAAVGPVVGPIIAIQWGWLPALLWVTLGVLAIGWVHDYASAMVGLRSEGQTFGALSYRLISPRGRLVLLFFLYFYLLLIVAAFGNMIATAMATLPSIPLAIIIVSLAGVVAGQMIYRHKIDILVTTILMVGISLFGVWLGTQVAIPASKLVWILFALGFSYLGAVLPIWSYAQPINYVSFYLVFMGIVGAGIGVLIGHPQVTTPAFTSFQVANLGPLWPILFVTIACGAVSGWHSLVSSSGTARQLESEVDACPVTAGAMFSEMILAVLAIIVAAATYTGYQAYAEHLRTAQPGGVFAHGMSSLLGYLGIPQGFGEAFAGAIFVILAITVMQLVVRFMRVATVELAGDALPPLRNIHVSTILALGLGFVLIYTGTFQHIWVLFGGSNQLMAALALMIIAIWLVRKGKKHLFASVPMGFMLVTTIAALSYTSYICLKKSGVLGVAGIGFDFGNLAAGIIGIMLIIASLILGYDGLKAFSKALKGRESESDVVQKEEEG